MKGQTALASIFGGLFGTSAGSGMGLMIFVCGLGCTLVGLSGYLFPAIRNVESLLPDHDQAASADNQSSAAA